MKLQRVEGGGGFPFGTGCASRPRRDLVQSRKATKRKNEKQR